MIAHFEESTDDAGLAPAPQALMELLLLTVNGQAYAISLEDIQEIVPMAELSRPPGAPAVLAGMLDIGGQAIPVVQLGRLFDGALVLAGMYTPIVILRTPGHALALMVDRVDRIVSVLASDIVPIRETDSFNACATGILSVGGQTALHIAVDRILLSEERARLLDFETVARQRIDQLQEVGQ